MAWKNLNQKRVKVIKLRGVRFAQLEILDKMVAKFIQQKKESLKRYIDEVNKYYKQEWIKIIAEDDTSITISFKCDDAYVSENGIVTSNNTIVVNEDGKVYLSFPKIFERSISRWIEGLRADIRFRVINGEGRCVVRFFPLSLKLREVALKELERNLS